MPDTPNEPRIALIEAHTDEADANAATTDEAEALLAGLQATGKTPRGALTQLLLSIALLLQTQFRPAEHPDGHARQQHLINEIPAALREMLTTIQLQEADTNGTTH